jgi:FkbM family methyltransferase
MGERVIGQLLKASIRRMFEWAGFEIRRVTPGVRQPAARDSVLHTLEQARLMGFVPTAVIDVGAAYGSFTGLCQTIFPNARYLLLEPLEEYRPMLEQAKQSSTGVDYCLAAAAAQEGDIVINVHPDLVGSSLCREVESGTGVNGVTRRVPSVTVDGLLDEKGLSGPYLLKVDVQGAELEVLAGAERTLRDAELVVLEVSFFKFFETGPECTDVIAYMKARGFVPYDIVGRQYRPLDGALSQADIAFVREAGIFRRQHAYATAEQREAQNRQMQKYLDHVFAGHHHE